MALHGPIGITLIEGGNKVIGYWDARRTVDLHDQDQTSIYACEVMLNDEAQKFEVEHQYSDGALVLLAKVIAKAAGMEIA